MPHSTTSTTDLADTCRDRATSAVMKSRDQIVALSRDIHAHPELAFDERYAAERVASELESAGFAVTREAYGVDTSVEGVFGSGEMRIVLCAEYDALPEIGHACGHNMIAAAAVGAGIGLSSVADELDLQIVVLGTPAEEGGGGKIELLRQGAWEGAACSLMVHPLAQATEVSPAVTTMQCIDRFDVEFLGRPAHAVIAPEQAINAGAAATLAEVAMGLLRQHLVDGIRLSSFVAEAGTATNIIPDHSRISIELRSPVLADIVDAKKRVLACMEGAAVATGCQWSQESSHPRYVTVAPDAALAAAWDENMARLGRPVTYEPITRPSTDMGNVSQVVPSIHPHICIKGAVAPTHTHEFAMATATDASDDALVDGATVMANTVVDVAIDTAARQALMRAVAERAPGATRIQPTD